MERNTSLAVFFMKKNKKYSKVTIKNGKSVDKT